MSTRRRPHWPRIVVVLLAAQALAVAGYLGIEAQRAPALAANLHFEEMNLPLPKLLLERPGEVLALPREDAHGSVTLLHVWATWCEPCREELPALLALEDDLSARLLLASSDETWPVIEHFFDGAVPATVWRLYDGHSSLPVDVMPTTLVLRGETIIARVNGARHWTDANAEALLRSAQGAAPPRPHP